MSEEVGSEDLKGTRKPFLMKLLASECFGGKCKMHLLILFAVIDVVDKGLESSPIVLLLVIVVSMLLPTISAAASVSNLYGNVFTFVVSVLRCWALAVKDLLRSRGSRGRILLAAVAVGGEVKGKRIL